MTSYTIDGDVLQGYRIGPDSLYVRDFLSTELLEELVQELQDAPWNDRNAREMRYRGNPLARDKFFVSEHVGDLVRRYSYPGWQWCQMLTYLDFPAVPAIEKLNIFIRERMSILFPDGREREIWANHVVATRYQGATDNIGWHADKTQDIRPETPILIFSFGDQREMHFRRRGASKPCAVVRMRPGSLLILGPETNATMEHTIVPVEQERLIKRKSSPPGTRSSLVFRDICSLASLADIDKKRRTIYSDAHIVPWEV